MKHDHIVGIDAGHSSSDREPILASIDALRIQAERLLEGRASAGPERMTSSRVRQIQDARRRREGYFSPELFGEPAWDMLLELFAVELEQQKVSVRSLCIASNVPATTALRWLKKLEDHGLIHRECDPLDARRFFVKLSEAGSAAIRRLFQANGGGVLPVL